CSVSMWWISTFAVVSRREKQNTAAHIRPMPTSRARGPVAAGKRRARLEAPLRIIFSFSIGGAAAGKIEHGAGRERAIARGGEGHRRRDFLDIDEAAARNFRQHVVDVLLRH